MRFLRNPILAACTVFLAAHTVVAQNAYITNGGSFFVSVINTATNTVVATIPTPGGTNGVAVSPDGSKVYVTNGTTLESNQVYVIDTATNAVTATITVGITPAGIAVTPDGSRVYVGGVFAQTVSVIDTATNTVTATIPGFGRPWGIAIAPDGSHVYVADAALGAVFVIDPTTNTVTTPILDEEGPLGLAVTPDGSKLYVSNSNNSTVSVISTASNTVIATVSTPGINFGGVAITPDGSRAYVSDSGSNTVTVINTATDTVIATVPAGSGPAGIAVTPDGSEVYVANDNDNTISVINTATNTVANTVPVGTSPSAFGKFIQPSKVFSTMSAKLNLVPGPFGSFNLNATFVLASAASIDPVTEPLTFTIGQDIVTIPAGSFHQLKNGSKSGGWVFSGNVGGVNLNVQIDSLGGGAYQFKATGSPVNFTGITSPTVVSISINGNSGKTQAKF